MPAFTRLRAAVVALLLVVPASWVCAAAPVARAATACPEPSAVVSTGADLAAALAGAAPGDSIHVADGTYDGAWTASTQGTEAAPIWLCGGLGAVLTNDGHRGGYGLHLDGASWWRVRGLTVTWAAKGIIVDAAEHVEITGTTVHGVGDEGIHLRTNTVDSLVAGNTIFDTGNRREKFGEGVYIGSSDANWGTLTGGQPDRSDRNTVSGNTITGTTAEAVDIKEGTAGGTVTNNIFDGAGQTEEGADSWVDAKGNNWTITGNTGTHSTGDGFQTHHRNLTKNGMGDWGLNNVFTGNTADVQGPGRGFYIHDPTITGNVVHCDNAVTAAALGYANLPCTP